MLTKTLVFSENDDREVTVSFETEEDFEVVFDYLFAYTDVSVKE